MDNSSAAESNTVTNATLQYLERISSSLEDKISHITEEISNILAAKDAAYEEDLIRRTSREIATLSLHLLEKESEVAALKAKESEYLQRIASLEAENTHLHKTLTLMLSSTSWKLTMPLRKFVGLLKR